MNTKGTSGSICAETVPSMTPFEKRQARRERREARAIAILHAMKPKPAKPEAMLRHTARPGDPNAPGFVYFAYCAGRIKIGYTTEVVDRMRGIATSSPFPVTLLLTIPGTPADEVAYHEMFSEDRLHLEWFDLSYELREFLQRNFQSGTFELMANAECDREDALLDSAAAVIAARKEIYGEEIAL